MEFEKSSQVGNLVFQKITEVGNLCRTGRAWEKTRREPRTPPPVKGGVGQSLTGQQVSRREPVERRAHVSAIIIVPAAYKRIRERLHGVAVVTLQLIDQTRGNRGYGSVCYPCTALKRHGQGANGLTVPNGLERQNITVSARTNGQNVPGVGGRASDAHRASGTGEQANSGFFHLENPFGLFFPTDKVSIHPLWCATQQLI